MSPAVDKRQNLTSAALTLFWEQGYGATSLANVAERAGVPLGNVYYYFKTKDSLADAIIAERRAAFDEMAGAWDSLPDPKDRLGAYLDMNEANRLMAAAHGCSMGNLSVELNKDRSALGEKAASVMHRFVDWSTEQFRAMGRDDADSLGVTFIGSIQGAMLLANSFNDAALFSRELDRIRGWIADL